jgi:hypothetical protein
MLPGPTPPGPKVPRSTRARQRLSRRTLALPASLWPTQLFHAVPWRKHSPRSPASPTLPASFHRRRTCSASQRASSGTQRHAMTNRRYLVPGDLESEHRGNPECAESTNPSDTHRGRDGRRSSPEMVHSPRWFRGDSPETRARPALTVDSTPLLEMRKKNLTRPTVFTRRDNSWVRFVVVFLGPFSAPSPSTSSSSPGCMRRGCR